MFKKILIANRGEIAVRVMRACKEMGIATVAIFSDIDRSAQHVSYADEAYHIGKSPAGESYLSIKKIIDVALKSHADAVHPGYGFLAENPRFADAVEKHGLKFIGPDVDTIRLLGDKITARELMEKAGVPIVPGIKKPVKNSADAHNAAIKIGYPLLLKAAAGGGGKGMRIVSSKKELDGLFKMAQSEARSAFGDDRIYIEKYLQNPRHIEIQILADKYGNIIHLGERECSIQRRHQKVIEESPSPIVDPGMRQVMGQTAIQAAKASKYINAGTVEFLVDQDKQFYFLEVNTRLQVEHPVTEMVTGIDLVREQLLIASGEKLSSQQNQIEVNGSAIECRIYAEDPNNNFLPSSGRIQNYREPAGPGIRVDSGFTKGDSISIYYDPLIAKLVAWGEIRERAIQRMKRALDEYVITGIKTVIPFLKLVMDHADFQAGSISTHFIEEQMSQSVTPTSVADEDLKAMAILSCLMNFQNKNKTKTLQKRIDKQNWKTVNRQLNL